MSTKTLRVMFDIDGTLRDLQADRIKWETVDVLRWFKRNGHTVGIWSGGGEEYAKRFAEKVGLDFVDIICAKNKENAERINPDLAFDDEIVELAKVNVQV